MINLLPPNHRKKLAAARHNVLLLRYNLLIGGAFLFLSAAIGVAYIYIATEKSTVQRSITENQSKEGEFQVARSQITEARGQLSSAKSILDTSNTSYSRALVRVSKLFPEGTSLQSLNLNPESFETPQNFTVNITGEKAAINLLNSLESSPYVISAVKGRINTSSAEGGSSAYPYTMDVTVTLSKEVAK